MGLEAGSRARLATAVTPREHPQVGTLTP